MRFQERDAEILRWVNGFGFASADQIRQFMGVANTAAYVRVKKLVDAGYMTRERILHGQARIHRVTKQGVIAMGAQVKKGEKSTPIVFYKTYEVETENAEDDNETRMFAHVTPSPRVASPPKKTALLSCGTGARSTIRSWQRAICNPCSKSWIAAASPATCKPLLLISI